jgi:hypothetical protein
LATRRDRHRKGTPEWIRLGELLAARRIELDPAWFDRGAFAKARGINLKLTQDIENNARENFTPLTLKEKVAPAYGVTIESVRAVLDDDGELEPTPGSPPHKPPRSLRRDPQPEPPLHLTVVPPLPVDEEEAVKTLLEGPGERFPELSPANAAAVQVHLPAARELVEKGARAEAGARGVPVLTVLKETPAGVYVFPGDPPMAALWDVWREKGNMGVKYSSAYLAWGLAFRRAQEEFRAAQAGGFSAGEA